MVITSAPIVESFVLALTGILILGRSFPTELSLIEIKGVEITKVGLSVEVELSLT